MITIIIKKLITHVWVYKKYIIEKIIIQHTIRWYPGFNYNTNTQGIMHRLDYNHTN